MMLFMRTFSIFILIVVLTVLGAYLLDSETSKKQVLANKIVHLPTLFTLNPDYFEPVSQDSLTLSIKNSKIDKSKEQINTHVLPSTKKKKTSDPPAISNPKTPPVTVVIDKTPKTPAPKKETTPPTTTPNTEPTASPVQPTQPVNSLIAPTNDDSSSTQPLDSPAETTQPADRLPVAPTDTINDGSSSTTPLDSPVETIQPADSFLVAPTDTTNNDSSVTDPQQILDAQRDWMGTTLGASESELPTKYILEESSVKSPDTGNITFDKTITGSDFSIQYIVSDGVLSVGMKGSVPDNLIPPGF
jgi:hypothetical protein